MRLFAALLAVVTSLAASAAAEAAGRVNVVDGVRETVASSLA